jgi:tRNA(adenine34) deaminase
VSRLDRVVFGAADPRAGFAGSLGNLLQDTRLNHAASVTGGVLADECGDLLQTFFRERR